MNAVQPHRTANSGWRILMERRGMNAPGNHEHATDSASVTDAVCTSCGCLCDDIAVQIKSGGIVAAHNACALGQAGFAGDRALNGAECTIEGRVASMEEAVERAARLLANARYPLIAGLTETTTDGQRAAVRLADCLGGVIDTASDHSATLALQEIGEVTCTLGEVKNRGDLIVVWRADPIESHPRLFDRYVLEPAGTFLPRGRLDRFCVVVDVHETTSARQAADQFIAIADGGEFTSLWVLRALAQGIDLDAADVAAETGVDLATWQGLLRRMKAARYGVLCYSTSSAQPQSRRAIAHAIHALVRDMNAHCRFVCMPLAATSNGAGAENVLAWSTGYPFAVCLAQGYPRFGPLEFTANDVLGRREADAVVFVGADTASRLDNQAYEHLSTIPSILVGCTGARHRVSQNPDVALPTAAPGVHTAGGAYRMDGVPIALRAGLAAPWPTDAAVLSAIEARVRQIKA